MRPTWHFVTADDIRWLVRLTSPRVNTVSSHYYKKAELIPPRSNEPTKR